ncbi:glycosyltransferase [Kocuria kalidii]|uniref:glycosyltransferase family 2 protein n=1 Tax=Kocuria kalidii TaxID=3376283 RepID=UPI00378AF8FD
MFYVRGGSLVETQSGVAIFFPAWNEAANLPYVVESAITYLQSRGEPYTVIIVDDGSTDNTVEIVQELENTYPGRLRYVRHDRNLGYGAALRTGFAEGLRTGLDWVGFCDADGQFNPRDVDKLIRGAAETGSEVAIGYRIKRADTFERRMMGLGWRWLSQLVLGYNARDVDCGFKVFRRQALAVISADLRGDHATISPEMLARAMRAGLRITEVGVNHYPRHSGEASGANMNVVWASLLGLIFIRQSFNRTVEMTPRTA